MIPLEASETLMGVVRVYVALSVASGVYAITVCLLFFDALIRLFPSTDYIARFSVLEFFQLGFRDTLFFYHLSYVKWGFGGTRREMGHCSELVVSFVVFMSFYFAGCLHRKEPEEFFFLPLLYYVLTTISYTFTFVFSR